MTFSEEQIQDYKAKYRDLYLITVDDKSCLLHKPTRQTLSYVSSIKDPIRMSEAMLGELWVAGDEDIKNDDELFMAVVAKMDEVIKVKEAEIKKL